ncbi:hypothetical protein Hanom_Chr00s000002g01599521 [Helianthus anomalus]
MRQTDREREREREREGADLMRDGRERENIIFDIIGAVAGGCVFLSLFLQLSLSSISLVLSLFLICCSRMPSPP